MQTALAGLVVSNIWRRRFRSSLLMTAVGLVAAMGYLGFILLGQLQQSLEVAFERLGADLLVVDNSARVNLTQALLTVEPEAPPLSKATLDAVQHLPPSFVISPQRAVFSSTQLGMDLGLGHGSTVPLYGIDPVNDTSVQSWLEDHRGIDFQDGQVILGHRIRGRLGDRVRLQGHTFQVFGRLAPTGITSHENGVFFTLSDLQEIMPTPQSNGQGVNGLLVQAPANRSIDELRFNLLAELDGVKVVGGRTLLSKVRQGGNLSLKIIATFTLSLLISVLLLIGLYSFGMASERRQELGLLLSLGATPTQVTGLLIGETTVLCAMGSGIGVSLAMLLRPSLQEWIGWKLQRADLPLLELSTKQLVWPAVAAALIITVFAAFASLLATATLLRRDPILLVQSDD